MIKNNVLIGLVIALVCVIFFILITKPEDIIIPFDDSDLRRDIEFKDSLILDYQNEIIRRNLIIIAISKERDSLVSLKKSINKNYDKQKKFINSADAFRVDSVIRANL